MGGGKPSNTQLVRGAMAPASMELRCTKGGCQFVTPDMEPALAMEYMKQHRADEHSEQPVLQAQTKPRAKKVPRPQIKGY